jgi:hypothetical protein
MTAQVVSSRQVVYEPDEAEQLPLSTYTFVLSDVGEPRVYPGWQGGPPQTKCRVVAKVDEGEWEGVEASRLMRAVIADDRSHFFKLLKAIDPEAEPAIYEEEIDGVVERFYDPREQLLEYVGRRFTSMAGAQANSKGQLYNNLIGDPAPYIPLEQRRRRQRPTVTATVVEPETSIEEGDDDF